MSLEFTGERYIPELTTSKISYEHWHRYMFASRFCNQKVVLDIACGEGYGTAYISKTAKQVFGVDISEDTILHAKSKYQNDHTQFLASDANNIPLESSSMDVIVSFETLEHLSKEKQGYFLGELSRLLKRDGILIISTPNKKVYSDIPNYQNPYHLSELYKSEFEELLLSEFKNVKLFNQQIAGVSLISSPGESIYNIDHIHLSVNGFIPGRSEQNLEFEYVLAICSNMDMPAISGSILIDDNNELINEYTKQNT